MTEARLTAEVELHKSEDTSGVSARFSTGKASTATRRSRNAEAEKVQKERADELLKIAIEQGYMPNATARVQKPLATAAVNEIVEGTRARKRRAPTDASDLGLGMGRPRY